MSQGTLRSPVIYDADDRVEPWSAAADGWSQLVETALVALIPPRNASIEGGALVVGAPTQQAAFGLCDGEVFNSQPAAADCSGVLLEEDLVLTAGHCVGSAVCSDHLFVFGYRTDESGRLATIPERNVYRCAEVVSYGLSEHESDPVQVDFAVVRLDRPVEHHVEPLELTTSAPRLGEPVVMLGTPLGVPAKVALGGRVVDARSSSSDYFVADVDGFEGNSGAPVFTAEKRLVGFQIFGRDDLERDRDASCYFARKLPSGPDAEAIARVDHALDALCTLRASSLCDRLPSSGAGGAPSAEEALGGETSAAGVSHVNGCSVAGAWVAPGFPSSALAGVLVLSALRRWLRVAAAKRRSRPAEVKRAGPTLEFVREPRGARGALRGSARGRRR